MKIRKIMNHIKSLPKVIKQHPHMSPSTAMEELEHYTALASIDYYGNSLANAMSYYNKGSKRYAVISYKFASHAMEPKHFQQIIDKYKPTDYFVQLMIPNKVITRKLTMKDVLQAQKRVLKQRKTIKARDKYDPNGNLETERDLTHHSMQLTSTDLSFILFSYHVSHRQHSKELIRLINNFIKALNGIGSVDYRPEDTKLLIKLMQDNKQKVFNNTSNEDQKNWYRCINKFKAYNHQLKMDNSINNPLLQSAIKDMKAGKVRQAFDSLLKNMTIDHDACRNRCYDRLSRTALNTMMKGTHWIQFADLDDLITGTKRVANTDPIQREDYYTLKSFANKGYKYAMIDFYDDNSIRHISPISKSFGLLILNKIIANYKNHTYPNI